MARLLITGGAGFIGSHTCLVLLNAGHDLVIFDSFVNSSHFALERVAHLCGISSCEQNIRMKIIKGDIRDQVALKNLFTDATDEDRPIEAVIHFAGLKSVSESINNPMLYWDVNVNGSRCLISTMNKFACTTLVLSSSATLYGAPKSIPIAETASIQPINPYGKTKAAIEQMLSDLKGVNNNWRIASLRYFNPVGAHPTGHIGEDPLDTPHNLFPFLSQVALGKLKLLKVFGGDWPTPDGTCIRDYIHVMDLAEGHLYALDFLLGNSPEMIILNLGSGIGHSVLEVINSFKKTTGKDIPYEIVARRPGDASIAVADPSKAKEKLGWSTTRTLSEICQDGWNWQVTNPNGYSERIV